ncbi:MAG TPA: alpha-L-arabinofuranosidase C-terminal domain-containing protein [Verrucomicrobiae bacterium]|nr:alpha-L-arabinofuranosidase C-terminal domain-containing protein [Verrucomicrobiae bacterium]
MNNTIIFRLAGILSAFVAGGHTQEATIMVHADHVLHQVSPYLTGACLEDVNHEIYGGIYSQMIFGESFQEPAVNNVAGAVSGMWSPIRRGTATGRCSLETTNPFVGTQSQVITFTAGTGQVGIANQGLNHWGMALVGGRSYTGCLDVRAAVPTILWVALESADGSRVYAEQSLSVTSHNWQHLNFTLAPSAGDTAGRFSIRLNQPGSVVVGYAFLQPGPWGCFRGLPVRKDVAEGLINQGITILRYGGSMVNAPGYRWKKMIGSRDRRPPYTGTWYPYSSDGWGIPDFLNFCEAAGFLAVPDFNMGETPQDMSDFIEYVNGPTNSVWGAQRLADGHPLSYGLKYIELGNEEKVNAGYFQKFQPLAEAIWAGDSNITIVVGDFAYSQTITDPFNFSGAASGITTLAAHHQILQLAKKYNRAVWFDVHVGTDGPTPDSSLAGMFSYEDALGQIAGGANDKVVVFELNAQNHSQRRALANALAIEAVERDGRIPIVTSANCLQPDGQNNNGWDQGLLFLNPSQVWLQPPGYVTQMFSHSYEASLVESQVEGPVDCLKVNVKRSQDGKKLVLGVINPSEKVTPASIIIRGYSPTQAVAGTEELAGPLAAVNTAKAPDQIQPIQRQWRPRFENGKVEYDFQPHSFTVIKFD